MLRGGAWNNNPQNLRSANRNNNNPTNRNNNNGFRLASTPVGQSRRGSWSRRVSNRVSRARHDENGRGTTTARNRARLGLGVFPGGGRHCVKTQPDAL